MQLKHSNRYVPRYSEASKKNTYENLQEHIDEWVDAGWKLSHFSTAVDTSGGVLHSFIWREEEGGGKQGS
jgi:hypothetical protein